METNVLRALFNLTVVKDFSLPTHYGAANRMNSMGVALEYFVKDVFCDSLGIKKLGDKDREYTRYLSYIGNANNPPDFIIRKGDAVEVKKISNPDSGLALNSSYPKDKLHKDNPLLTDACRECEDWEIKDMIYAVGVVEDEELASLWFVHGDCYAADRKVYEGTRQKILDGVNAAEGIEFSKTREIGHVNRVDPLGITYMRIRGMWGIENPMKVFSPVASKAKKPSIVAIMRKEKYTSFPGVDRKALEGKGVVRDGQVKNPNNPAKMLDVKIIEL